MYIYVFTIVSQALQGFLYIPLYLKTPPHMEDVFINGKELLPLSCKPFAIEIKYLLYFTL